MVLRYMAILYRVPIRIFGLVGLILLSISPGIRATEQISHRAPGDRYTTAGDSTEGRREAALTAPGPENMGREERTGGNFLDFPLDLIISGGPGKDGIPALTDPSFVDSTSPDADYLSDDDLVLGVVINGEAKAYPHNIGWWHEIVNDVIGGQPIIVTFASLTGTGMVFDGTDEDGSRITAGVSGLLFNNNLIMFDRRDDTLYPQMIFRGVTGPRTGRQLNLLPVIETTWRYWKRLYPNTRVVSGNTGIYSIDRYKQYPYSNYRVSDSFILFPPFPPLQENLTSQLYGAKQRTLGIRFNELAVAYPFQALEDEIVINDTVADHSIVVVWYAHEQLAIPYFRTVEGQTLTFEKVASDRPVYPFLMRDEETGTAWTLKGEEISGPLSGTRLRQAPAHNAFWFAWATFWQNTGITTIPATVQPPTAAKTDKHRAVVIATVTQNGAPAAGLDIAFSRSIAGRPPDYRWAGTTGASGQAEIEITADAPRFWQVGASGYYAARAFDPASGEAVGKWGSIPVNGGKETQLSLSIGGRARVEDERQLEAPASFKLNANSPNPFNPDTHIAYRLLKAGEVSLVIYSGLGQHVRTLVQEYQNTGFYRVMWNGKDALEHPVSSGIYLYRLKSNDMAQTRRMLLLK